MKWYAEDFVYEIKESGLAELCLELDNKPSRVSSNLVNTDSYKTLTKHKDSILSYKGNIWNHWSSALNPYDKVRKNIQVPSSSYYTLLEILKYFNSKQTSGAIFICPENKEFIQCCKDLYPNSTQCVHKELLYDHSVILNKFNLIITTGSFDVSIDPNNPEQYLLRLIFCEIVPALTNIEVGGTFICKIFDSVTKTTCQLISSLKNFFEKVFLISASILSLFSSISS